MQYFLERIGGGLVPRPPPLPLVNRSTINYCTSWGGVGRLRFADGGATCTSTASCSPPQGAAANCRHRAAMPKDRKQSSEARCGPLPRSYAGCNPLSPSHFFASSRDAIFYCANCGGVRFADGGATSTSRAGELQSAAGGGGGPPASRRDAERSPNRVRRPAVVRRRLHPLFSLPLPFPRPPPKLRYNNILYHPPPVKMQYFIACEKRTAKSADAATAAA